MQNLLSISYIQKSMMVFTMVAIMFFGMVFLTPKAEAQSTSSSELAAMQEQIAQLTQILNSLLAQIAAMQNYGNTNQTPDGGYRNTSITVGSEVEATDNVRVRNLPGYAGHAFAIVPMGTDGEVVGGPQQSNGYTWWQVAYDNGVTGWSAEPWLEESHNYETYQDVNLVARPQSGDAPLDTVLTYVMNTERECDSVGYQIYFGDGVNTAFSKPAGTCHSYVQHTEHTYEKPGTYTATISRCTEDVEKGESCPLKKLDSVQVIVGEPKYSDVSDVDIEIGDTSSFITSYSSNLGDWGRFKVEFQITAGDEDIWIKNSIHGTFNGGNGSLYQPKFSIFKNGVALSGFAENFSSVQPGFASDAPYAYPVTSEKNDNYYVVRAGKTEDFELDVTVTVDNSGMYYMLLEGPVYVLTKSGETISLNINEKQSGTPALYLKGEDSVQDNGLLGTYKGYMNGSLFITTQDITKADALANCKINASNNASKKVYCTWEGNVIYDNQTVTVQSDPTDAELQAQIDQLIAQIQDSQQYEDEDTDTMSNRELQAMIDELIQQVEIQNQNTPSITYETYETALGVGAYEGTYPAGVTHGYNYHPQGEIDVYIPDAPHLDGDLLLVLSSYEPVKWNITGPGAVQVGKVFATGYYEQEVSGLQPGVTVDTLTWKEGDSTYFQAHSVTSPDYTKLHNYVQDNYSTYIEQFKGSYTQDSVVFTGFKG